MSSFSKYETRSQINKGARLELADPSTGQNTGDWLKIRYSLADDYDAAREEALRATSIAGEEDAGSVERSARLLTPLIAGWSFDEECSPGNVYEFLCMAPHLHNEIIKRATLEGKFFSTPSSPSANGPDQSSSSTDSQTAQKTG